MKMTLTDPTCCKTGIAYNAAQTAIISKAFEASDFTEEQIAEFREAFVVFDETGDGTISTKELQKLFQSMGQNATSGDIRRLLETWGIEPEGQIDFPEFLNIMSTQMGNFDNEEVLMEAFRVFDRDGNGYITGEELKKVMLSMGEQMSAQDVDDMISQADMDGDGMINFEEFVNTLLFNR